ARFIEKHQMRVAVLGAADDAREGTLAPQPDAGFIALAGPPPGFLRRPAQAVAEKAADVVVVKGDAEMALDKVDDAGPGPQLVGPAVGLSTLAEQVLEIEMLFVRQTRRGAGVRLGSQAIGLLSEFEPAVHGSAGDAQDPGHGLGALAEVHGPDRLVAPALQFRSGSHGSTHTTLEGS